MIVGVTGSREGMSENQLTQILEILKDINVTEFHHGDCDGVDAEMHILIRSMYPDAKIVVHPPVSNYLRAFMEGNEIRDPLDYKARDRKIVDSVEMLIGVPLVDTYQRRSGTWYTINYGRKMHKEVRVVKR